MEMEKEEIVVQNGELFGKGRAELRNQQILQLIRDWEKQRDALLDEISYRKGQVDLLEELIKQSYEMMLDVNKEEQDKEQALIDSRLEDIKKLAEGYEEQAREEAALKKHKKKQEDVKAGKVKGKAHPDDRGKEVRSRKRKKD
jgi:hypothetical protein